MKVFTAQSILLFSLSISGGICTNNWNVSLPDGNLLAISVIRNKECENISLFSIDFSGDVTMLWDFSLTNPDTLNTPNLFAVNAESKLVYLGSRDEFLALDLVTGAVKIKILLKPPNMQYFWNYDYVARDETIYGVCSGHSQWNWCRIKQTEYNTVQLSFLYKMPYTTALSPTDGVYYMDSEEQTIWYYPFQLNGLHEFAVGINYTSGNEVFRSAVNPKGTEDMCIVRDHNLNRVFTYVHNPDSSAAVGIGELFPRPEKKKILLDFSQIDGYTFLSPISYGTCVYDQSTHTMMGLMGPATGGNPISLLLVDVVTLAHKLTPLTAFQKWNNLSLTSIKYIPKRCLKT